MTGLGELDSMGLPATTEIGRICAIAGQAQRETREWATQFGDLYTAKPFDAALYGTVCLCTAFSAPWLSSAELRMANRAALWGFAVDWLIDYVASSSDEVSDIVAECLAVAEGADPAAGSDLARCLADIRDELAKSPAAEALWPAWREDLRRFVQAMAREWEWNAARTAGRTTHPTFQEYLDNTDNFGFSFACTSHLVFTGPPPPPGDISLLQEASWAAQRAMRLINDLGTYERDMAWGDLNALLLGVTRDELRQQIGTLIGRFRKLAEPLRRDHPQAIDYIARQMAFCIGFYQVTDYWGALTG